MKNAGAKCKIRFDEPIDFNASPTNQRLNAGFDRDGCKTPLDGRGLARPKTTTLRRVCLNPKEIPCLRLRIQKSAMICLTSRPVRG
jgi:hypothetical protein